MDQALSVAITRLKSILEFACCGQLRFSQTLAISMADIPLI